MHGDRRSADMTATDNMQVFHACPSLSVEAFFMAVPDASNLHVGISNGLGQALDATAELVAGVQVIEAVIAVEFVCACKINIRSSRCWLFTLQAALRGAQMQRAHQQQWFGAAFNMAVASLPTPEWVADQAPQIALQALGSALVR